MMGGAPARTLAVEEQKRRCGERGDVVRESKV